MKRREFVMALGATAAATGPLSAVEQQRNRAPTIGFLGASSAHSWAAYVKAFEQRLGELGWAKNKTMHIDYRWAGGHSELYPEIAAQFVREKVDVIVTVGSAVAAAKRATSTIPIVFALSVDPVGSGIVANLAHPGGNATGISLESTDLASKRVEFLRDAIPQARRLAILANVGYPAAALEMRDAEAAARVVGLETDRLEIRRADDLVSAIGGEKGKAQALYTCIDPLVSANRPQIAMLAIAARLASIFANRQFVLAEGLMSYGPSNTALFRRAADYVDKILRGAKASEIPVEQPTKFELVVNLKTAKALGLRIPEAFLIRADEVIE